MKTEVCNFSKSGSSATGAVGVLTYDLIRKGSHKAGEKLAIMFSVPYDYNFYKNWAAVGIYDQSRECKEDLYKEMYNEKKDEFVREEAKGSCMKYSGKELEILCTMSPVGRAIMKVEVWDKSYFFPTQRPF